MGYKTRFSYSAVHHNIERERERERESERVVELELALAILEGKKVISGIHPTRFSSRKILKKKTFKRFSRK